MEKRPYPGSKFSTFIPFIAKNLAPSFWPKHNTSPLTQTQTVFAYRLMGTRKTFTEGVDWREEPGVT